MLRDRALAYLGHSRNVLDSIDGYLDKAIKEVSEKAQFIYNFQIFYNLSNPNLGFLNNEGYHKFLKGCTGVILVAATLGIEIDRYIKYLSNYDLAYSVVFDAVSSAYLEEEANEYELFNLKILHSSRFCPGYGNTSIKDNLIIGKILNVHKNLGITFLDSGLMVPQKSIIGIIGLNINKKNDCDECILIAKCEYKERNIKCYQNWEKKF